MKQLPNDRSLPIEIRLLRYYAVGELMWAAFNSIISFIFKFPTLTLITFALTFAGVFILFCSGHVFKIEKVTKEIYFICVLLSTPFKWLFLGGAKTSASILFICEIVLFVMCLKGTKRRVYLIAGVVSISITQMLNSRFPALSPIDFEPRNIAVCNMTLGLSTTLLIMFLLINQKKEYVRERDIAIASEKELERSNRLQKNFLANMSHEIRSPLGIVLGFNTLIGDCSDLDQIREYSRNITRAGKTLQIVINDILDYSKIESGKLDIINDDYYFKDLVDDIATDIELKCAEKGLNFEKKVSPDIPPILHGDSIRIKQCLLNILSNAVKYTEEGTVTLEISDVSPIGAPETTLSFIIRDTGRGIAKEDIPKLFSAFQRLSEGLDRGIEGTGLGLAITKNLLTEMNGEIRVDSTLGVGSTFTIILKQATAKGVPSQEKTSIKDISLDGLKCLVVDDTKVNLILVSKLLAKEGVEVETCDSGMKCLEQCRLAKYDFILLDHMMPEMNGVATFIKLREMNTINQETPVIMLTANTMAGACQEYLDIGFCGYVSKPIDSERLKEVISNSVG